MKSAHHGGGYKTEAARQGSHGPTLGASGCRFVCQTTAAEKSLLAFLETVEDQFHSRRNAQLIENTKKIISHDLLLARGYSPVQVALLCYIVATAFVGIAWKERGMSPMEASALSFLSFAALGVVEVRLGSLQVGQNARAPVVTLRAVPNKRAPTQ